MNNVRKIRKANKLTLQELSQMTKISVGYLSHLENGTRINPSYNTLNKLAKALNTTISELYKEE